MELENRRFYKIMDRQLYERRLDAYWDFIARFYAGVSAGASISRDRQFGIFSLDRGRIGIAVFNSCLGNDCFAIMAQLMLTR